MRFLTALFFGVITSFFITPIGGVIIFCLIYFGSKIKPQSNTQNVYINTNPEHTNYSYKPERSISEEKIAEKLKNDQKKNVLRELDILDKKYKRNLISFDEYQERVKQLSK
jgi:hypothetical protein